MDRQDWLSTLVDTPSPSDSWQAVFNRLAELASEDLGTAAIHAATVDPDRILAEAAWDLWQSYSQAAPRTSDALRQWWAVPSSYGRAVLVLDALSLRELPSILKGAADHGASPASVRITGSEVPSDTDRFAMALGAPSRASLSSNGAPAGFAFHGDGAYTDVLSWPFEDCAIPHDPNIFLWHTLLDDQIHLHKRLPEQVAKVARDSLASEGFWSLVNNLRQGRRLVITGDHGYAVSQLFSTEVRDPELVDLLRPVFGASRSKPATETWSHHAMPPLVLTEAGHHVVVGQRKWAVSGGFPRLCHGGLSLLEVAVPFVEFSPL